MNTRDLAIVVTAWAVGHAQAQPLSEDTFLVRVDAPGERTALVCEKVCNWGNPVLQCNMTRCGMQFNQDGAVRR